MNLDNAHHISDRNFRFLGHLDSAKTAHPVPSANQINNWWMPANLETSWLHSAAAQAMTIKQVLWGEIIQLPRNQSFDSPAWFPLAEHFIKAKLPLFSICVIGKSATPQAFVEDCAQQFEPTSPFALSGWPGLEKEERQIIADNIRWSRDFTNMFRNIKLDSNWQVTFEYQRDVLQRVLKYLQTNYEKYPPLIRAVEYAPTSTWHRINRDYTDSVVLKKIKDKYGEDLTLGFLSVFQEIKEKADRVFGDDRIKKNIWLSSRTNLYQEIYRQPSELRELLRAEIDRCYVETTGESVTKIGCFGDADRSDTGRDIEDRDYDSQVFDFDNDPSGLNERYIIDFENMEDQLKMNDNFLMVINDELVIYRILELRRLRNCLNIPENYVVEKEKEHLDFLCEALPDAVIRKDNKFNFSWRVGKICVNVLIGVGIGSLFGPSIAVIGGGVSPILEQVIEEVVAIGTDETVLSENIKEKLFQKLTKKRKVALTGILRDWLDKPIMLKE
ncbi:MAG: hypothetical protein JEZ00_09180 [Anaerolineaceae bacterium]|nr:hypothetical protein [Anaerolineaceae bacterium]